MAIQEVILWQNGNVMVFDERGEQMPEYQHRDDVDRIVADAPPEARFSKGVWGKELFTCSREAFRSAAKTFAPVPL